MIFVHTKFRLIVQYNYTKQLALTWQVHTTQQTYCNYMQQIDELILNILQ